MNDDLHDAVLAALFLAFIAGMMALMIYGDFSTSSLPYTVVDGVCLVPCLDVTGQFCMGPTPIPCPADAGP